MLLRGYYVAGSRPPTRMLVGWLAVIYAYGYSIVTIASYIASIMVVCGAWCVVRGVMHYRPLLVLVA